MKKLRIGLVTAYPPTQGRLSEYGWHLARHLAASPRVAELHVLADRVDGAESVSDRRISVDRCWTFDRFDLLPRVSAAISGKHLDAIWFNIHLTSTSRRRMPRVSSLSAPAALRFIGHPTIVTLHHLPDLTDLAAAGINPTPLNRWGASAAVRLLNLANLVCVPLPEYADILERRYRARRVRFIPLGTPGLPPATGIVRDPAAVLAFGRFGSYKRLDVLLEAVVRLQSPPTPVRLHIAGSDSIYSPGYLSSLQSAYGRCPNIIFHGYVREEDVPVLFQRCAAAVLPYRTATGVSSVAMQAAMYGTAIVAADVPALHLTGNLGLQMEYLAFDDPERLACGLRSFLADSRAHLSQIEHNLAYSRTVAMPSVVDAYLDAIESLGNGG